MTDPAADPATGTGKAARFIALVLPALMMGLNKRETLRIPAILCLLGLAANFFVWGQIVTEFAQSATR